MIQELVHRKELYVLPIKDFIIIQKYNNLMIQILINYSMLYQKQVLNCNKFFNLNFHREEIMNEIILQQSFLKIGYLNMVKLLKKQLLINLLRVNNNGLLSLIMILYLCLNIKKDWNQLNFNKNKNF